MNRDVILIEDDQDDRDLFRMAFDEVCKKEGFTNKLVFITDSAEAIDFLHGCTRPFALISDINMPKIDGFQLKEQIEGNPELKSKCFPFMYLTTSGNNTTYIEKAYRLSAQGYFVKPRTYSEYKSLITSFMLYWRQAKKPGVEALFN